MEISFHVNILRSSVQSVSSQAEVKRPEAISEDVLATILATERLKTNIRSILKETEKLQAKIAERSEKPKR